MTKDEQRILVLRYYYERNEREPGGMEQTSRVADFIELEAALVSEAQLYLIDKGFLHTTTRSQPLHGGYSTFLARITSRGIDFIEHPTDFMGRDVPAALVSIVAGGNVNGVQISGRDQQVVHGDISGALAQGSANASSSLLPFPIASLRELLASSSVASDAAEKIATESVLPKPRWGAIVAAAEVIKNVGVTAEAGHVLTNWFTQPAIPDWVQHAVHALFGA